MFKLDFMTEDKELVKLMHSLSEFKILNLSVVPVANAAVKKGKAVQKHEGGTMVDVVAAAIAKQGAGKGMTSNEIMDIVIANGGNAKSRSYFLGALVKRKAVKNRNKDNLFVVN